MVVSCLDALLAKTQNAHWFRKLLVQSGLVHLNGLS